MGLLGGPQSLGEAARMEAEKLAHEKELEKAKKDAAEDAKKEAKEHERRMKEGMI
jgi:hypothetical protein